MLSIKDQMKQDGEEYGTGQQSDFFRFEKTGDYKFRILAPMVALATHFFGAGQPSHICYGMHKGCMFHGATAPRDDKGNEKKPSLKYTTYILDRTDGKVKLAELPWSVVSVVGDLEVDEDYGFSGYPMPYDVKVKYDKENKDPKAMYKTIAVPLRVPIAPEELTQFEEKMKKMTPEAYVNKRKEKQLEKHMQDGSFQRAAEERERKLKEAREESFQSDAVEPVIEYPEMGEEPAF